MHLVIFVEPYSSDT